MRYLLLLLIVSSCTKQQCPELFQENIELKRTLKSNAAHIIYLQEIIYDQKKIIKRK